MSSAPIDVLDLPQETEGLPPYEEQVLREQPVLPELSHDAYVPAKHIGSRLFRLLRLGRRGQPDEPGVDLWSEQGEIYEAPHPFHHDTSGNMRDGRTGKLVNKTEVDAYFDERRETHAAQTNAAMSYEALAVDDLAYKLGEAYYYADQTTADNVSEVLENKLDEIEAGELDRAQDYNALSEIIAMRDRVYDIAEQRLAEMTLSFWTSVEDATNAPKHQRPEGKGRRRDQESIERLKRWQERRSRAFAAAALAISLGGAAWVTIYGSGLLDDDAARPAGAHEDEDREADEGGDAEISGYIYRDFNIGVPEAPAAGNEQVESESEAEPETKPEPENKPEPEPESPQFWEDEIAPGDGPVHSIEDYTEDAGLGKLNGAQTWKVYLEMFDKGLMTSEHITGVGLYTQNNEVRYADTGMASFSPEAVEAMERLIVVEIGADDTAEK